MSNPSHASARILDYLPESADITSGTSSIICEDGDLQLLESDSIYICEDGISNFGSIDSILKTNFSNVCKRTHFRLS